jgi:uncharacterized phage protein (TIGR02218 family)
MGESQPISSMEPSTIAIVAGSSPQSAISSAQMAASGSTVVASVTIFRLEQEDDESEAEALVFWKGRLSGFRATGQEVVFDCESIFTSQRRTGARAMYSIQCRHALYGEGCGVDMDAFGVTGTVTSVDNLDIGVTLEANSNVEQDSDGNVTTSGYFIGGMIRFGDVYRHVVNQGDGFVRLWREMPDIQVGSSVTLYPGCQRDLLTCKTRFDNTANYGGFPWLPNRNPFSFVNNF